MKAGEGMFRKSSGRMPKDINLNMLVKERSTLGHPDYVELILRFSNPDWLKFLETQSYREIEAYAKEREIISLAFLPDGETN